jgi:penicillin-binding protein 1A
VPLTFDPSQPATPVPTPAPQPAKPRKKLGLGWRIAIVSACVLVAGLGAAAVTAGVIINGYISSAPPMPSRDALWTVRRTPGMTFLDRFGKLIATRGAKYGVAVKLSDLPAYVPKAFLAAEDRRFYQHGAVDFSAIARAALADMRAHRSAQGASTLTQQLARTLFLSRDPSLKRKVQEAYLAWELERQMSKDEVLELYLNRTYFGDGAYGLDAASETYFGKPASKLTVAEAAILAGLPNAPTRLALTNDMAGAVARGHMILGVMRQEGWIDDPTLASAMAQVPQLAPAHSNAEGDEAYVLDAAAAQATQLAGGAAPDLVVTTTIDPALQASATNIVRAVIDGEGVRRNAHQAALVSLAPDGGVLAMVGGVSHDASPFNRVTQAHRQPGSSFKAFVYGAAVERGATARDVWDDAPISYAGWTPQNYEGGYAGKVTLQEALARSLNTVSVRLTLSIGPASVADFARRLGLSDIPANPGPSIALGAYEVTPLELAGGYQVFQLGGGRTQPYLVSQVRSTRGDVIWAHADSAPTPVLDPLYATRMVGLLKGVIQFGTGTGANIGRPAAGKTGTSEDWRDAWFAGFTPDFTTVVWVGNDDGAPMAHVTGGQLPAEIWKKFMLVAEKGMPSRDFPWLVAEPEAPPLMNVDDSNTPYEDEPPDMETDSSGAADTSTADAGDDQSADDNGDRGPPGYYDQGAQQAGPNAYQGQPPYPYARNDPYDRGGPYQRDPYDRGDDADQPPVPPPNAGWRQQPPPGYDDPDADAAPQDQKQQGGPSGYPGGGQMPADGDPRYRY